MSVCVTKKKYLDMLTKLKEVLNEPDEVRVVERLIEVAYETFVM